MSDIKERTSPAPSDNPLLRHRATKLDRVLGSNNKNLAYLRLAALKHAKDMPSTKLPRMSRWVQMGPLAIPHGETYADPPTEVMVTGRVTSIVVDPTDYNIIYVGTALGGVWKTTNGGKEWAPQSDYEISSAIGALVLDPSNHNVVYAGTGEGNNILHERYDRFNDKSYYGYGVLKSVNGGQSWTLYGEAIFGGARFFRLAIPRSKPNLIFAATSIGLYRSMDEGTTWTKMTGNLPVATDDELLSAQQMSVSILKITR